MSFGGDILLHLSDELYFLKYSFMLPSPWTFPLKC